MKKQMLNIFKPDIEIIYSSVINPDYENAVINIDRVHGDLVTYIFSNNRLILFHYMVQFD